MSDSPFFSVILATFGRGGHIVPTIESVLRQSFGDFELIVVGDGCIDDTEAAVKSFPDARVTWRNLAQNTGSQSFPNNEGIHAARASWIAYIGHDDIWARDHLATIAQAIALRREPDFVVSGCIYFGPKGSDVYYVTGLFGTPDAPFRHFFPPTSLAHRRDVIARSGGWPDPRLVKAPVDADFLLRAAHARLRFASTERITAYKFAAGHRYLSYLRMSSDEQREMLRALEEGAAGLDTDGIVATAKQGGGYMSMTYGDYSGHTPGHSFERNRQNKGISRPALQPLHDRILIAQTEEPRGLDWHDLQTSSVVRYRWSGPSPRPKILIPYTGDRACVSIEVISKRPDFDLHEVALFAEDQRIDYGIASDGRGVLWLVANVPLTASGYTVLTLETPMFRPSDAGDTRRLGIAVADMVIEPA